MFRGEKVNYYYFTRLSTKNVQEFQYFFVLMNLKYLLSGYFIYFFKQLDYNNSSVLFFVFVSYFEHTYTI